MFGRSDARRKIPQPALCSDSVTMACCHLASSILFVPGFPQSEQLSYSPSTFLSLRKRHLQNTFTLPYPPQPSIRLERQTFPSNSPLTQAPIRPTLANLLSSFQLIHPPSQAHILSIFSLSAPRTIQPITMVSPPPSSWKSSTSKILPLFSTLYSYSSPHLPPLIP